MKGDLRKDIELLGLEALATGDPDSAILNAERRGANDVVYNDKLPKECPREQLAALGFQFGAEIDDLFVAAKLPDGWRKESDYGDPRHITLLNAAGHKRGSMFVKTVAYDRKATLSLSRRYQVTICFGKLPNRNDWNSSARWYAVVDAQTDAVLFSSKSWSNRQPEYWKVDEAEAERARAWLRDRFPDADDPLAYWADSAPAPGAGQ